MVKVARALSARDLDVFTFNFLYAERKKKVPDKKDVLEATWRAALRAVASRAAPGPLFAGGKSMGARIATQVAAADGSAPPAGPELSGLVLLGYPLHPPGKPEQLRSAHLPQVRVPMLFVQGSRDAFGTPAELEPVVRGLATGTRLFVVDGGDHSLAVPKSRGVTLDDTLARVAEEVVRFTASR
jgi:predicted alpha/beta-hydrolase family hydrolase